MLRDEIGRMTGAVGEEGGPSQSSRADTSGWYSALGLMHPTRHTHFLFCMNHTTADRNSWLFIIILKVLWRPLGKLDHSGSADRQTAQMH